MIAARFVSIIFAACVAALPAVAQNPFATVVKVNDSIITRHEVEQRALFLEILGQGGDLIERATEDLIDDRLRMQDANSVGLRLSEEDFSAALTEFASRADLGPEEFLNEIAAAGVAPETIRDFLEAGMAWRIIARGRFGPLAQITEDEIDRAMAQTSGRGGIQVLLSEIFIPAPAGFEEQSRALAERISRITSISEFADAAREHSVAQSAQDGGALDWIPLGNLPGHLRAGILAILPGRQRAGRAAIGN